jgi:hypothetical protein
VLDGLMDLSGESATMKEERVTAATKEWKKLGDFGTMAHHNNVNAFLKSGPDPPESYDSPGNPGNYDSRIPWSYLKRWKAVKFFWTCMKPLTLNDCSKYYKIACPEDASVLNQTHEFPNDTTIVHK